MPILSIKSHVNSSIDGTMPRASLTCILTAVCMLLAGKRSVCVWPCAIASACTISHTTLDTPLPPLLHTQTRACMHAYTVVL